MIPHIDEFDEKSHECRENADCKNTKGFYRCKCKTGFMEMDTTARVSQCLFGSLVVVNSLEKIHAANINELQKIILLGTARILRRFLSIQ